MKRALRASLLLAFAALAGFVASEATFRSSIIRQMLARFGFEQEISGVALNLRAASKGELVSDAEIDQQLNLLRVQFGDENAFAKALESSQLSLAEIRAEIAEHLRARSWIEKEIGPFRITPAETRESYESQRAHFLQPVRYRASHLFLAAPEESAPELVAAKRSAIQGLAVRMLAGESFARLVAETSEDAATKFRGGDLGFFTAARMPSEFFAEVEKLQRGQISAPFRSHLGYHIVQLLETRPPRDVSFEEARPEIALALENDQRIAAVGALSRRLGRP